MKTPLDSIQVTHWRIDPQGTGDNREYAFVRKGSALAYLIPTDRSSGKCFAAMRELHDLFNAAEEMYLALREYVERHEQASSTPPVGCPEYDLAVAALNKAEGKQ